MGSIWKYNFRQLLVLHTENVARGGKLRVSKNVGEGGEAKAPSLPPKRSPAYKSVERECYHIEH